LLVGRWGYKEKVDHLWPTLCCGFCESSSWYLESSNHALSALSAIFVENVTILPEPRYTYRGIPQRPAGIVCVVSSWNQLRGVFPEILLVENEGTKKAWLLLLPVLGKPEPAYIVRLQSTKKKVDHLWPTLG